MDTRVDGRSPHLCETLSLTYHPSGESGTGIVGPEGVTMLVLAAREEFSLAMEAEGLAASAWQELDSPHAGLRALHEFAVGDEDSSLALQELTTSLFASSARRGGAERRPSWWRRLEDRLESDLPTPWSLERLARDVGVHPVHLCSSYRRTTGRTIGETIRARRIERGCRLLLATDWSLGEIALELGYCDHSHFARAFRRTLGYAPSRLRRDVAACESLRDSAR